MIHCANPLYNVFEWLCFIGWLVVVIIPMKEVVFTSVQISETEIYSWMCYFYIIKSENWTPTKPIYKLQEKKLPMDYDKGE